MVDGRFGSMLLYVWHDLIVKAGGGAVTRDTSQVPNSSCMPARDMFVIALR